MHGHNSWIIDIMSQDIVVTIDRIVQRYCQTTKQLPEDIAKFTQFINWVKEEYQFTNFYSRRD